MFWWKKGEEFSMGFPRLPPGYAPGFHDVIRCTGTCNKGIKNSLITEGIL